MKRPPTVRRVIHEAVRLFAADQRVSYTYARRLLIGHNRHCNATCWRIAAMRCAYSQTGKSLPIIGRYFRRDHSTVHHAVHLCDPDNPKYYAVAHTRAVVIAEALDVIRIQEPCV